MGAMVIGTIVGDFHGDYIQNDLFAATIISNSSMVIESHALHGLSSSLSVVVAMVRISAPAIAP